MFALNPNRFRTVVVALAVGVVFVGCGGGSETSSRDATATSSAGPPAAQLVDLVGGGQIDLNSIEGTDTVLWFWAPW